MLGLLGTGGCRIVPLLLLLLVGEAITTFPVTDPAEPPPPLNAGILGIVMAGGRENLGGLEGLLNLSPVAAIPVAVGLGTMLLLLLPGLPNGIPLGEAFCAVFNVGTVAAAAAVVAGVAAGAGDCRGWLKAKRPDWLLLFAAAAVAVVPAPAAE
jgi:hypothetical protein